MTDQEKNRLSTLNLRASYRVQLRPEFGFEPAAALVPYLQRLGISHFYASPYLQAAAGSTHGYDVVNYNQINHALGGPAGLLRLVEALRRAKLGQLMDMVPNHMAISPDNPWWWDVLENGPSSRYAGYFDMEWDPPETRHSDQVLLPVLGDQYGRVLDAGELRLAMDEHAYFTIHYYDHVYPVDPHTLSGLLAAAAERVYNSQLAFLSGAFDRLPTSGATDRASAIRRYRDKEVLRELLARLLREQPGVQGAIQEVIDAVNADPDVLDAFLRRQNYRPAHWQISSRELGYRRFFDINTMIGLRMEDEQVYLDTHDLPLVWLRRGQIEGLRIDHPDGLRNPRAYFERLRTDAPNAWLLIEKILEPGEALPRHWPVDGTTGYDFLNRANGLLVDPQAEGPLSDFYAEFTGQSLDYPALVLEKKRMAVHEVLGSDHGRLVELFLQVCEANRRYRDYTRGTLSAALAEVAACLPVYRTYVEPDNSGLPEGTGSSTNHPAVIPEDQAYIDQAIAAAKANRPDIDPRLLDFLGDLLLLRERGPGSAELVKRFQQFTGPVMAKGVEDTLFYNYNRFISLNEVGGDPAHFGVSPAEFHRACQANQQHWPRTMLTTSTHDTKRSEDVRARLNVLSEIPSEWTAAVQEWSRINAPYRSGDFPDRNTEYLFYQNLVGAWPISVERMLQYMEKAGREAKQHTTWVAPNAEYEAAVADFVRGALADDSFVSGVEGLVERIHQAGWVNSLAQTLLKLTAPGIPDIYQGTELWDFSLVDPDNRRPVDYDLRARLLAELEQAGLSAAGPSPEDIWSRAEEGLPKLWVIRQALALRRRQPGWFGADSSYQPLAVAEDAGLAYMRAGQVAVVVPRLALRNRPRWNTQAVDLPEGGWRNLLTGENLPGGPQQLSRVFARFPVALLVRQEADVA